MTGTPGTGKTSLAQRLIDRGVAVLAINDYLESPGVVSGRDRARGAKIVDTQNLSKAMNHDIEAAGSPLVIEGHLAHEVQQATHALVLRVHPRTLGRRLRARGWADPKVHENLEAEALDVILQECVARFGERTTYELDTTGMRRPLVAARAMDVVRRKPGFQKHVQIGRISWSAEILRWY